VALTRVPTRLKRLEQTPVTPDRPSGRRTAALVAVALFTVAAGGGWFAAAAAAGADGETSETSETSATAGRVGVVSGGYWEPDGVNSVDSQYGRFAAAGVRYAREGFDWNNIQPTRGQWNWQFADATMTAASRHGIRVHPIFGYSALWASAWPRGDRPMFHPPGDPDDYVRYVVESFRRYGAGGSFWRDHPWLAPKPLTSAEIWNEPYGWWFWGIPNPARYADLVERTALALGAAGFGQVRIVMHGAVWTIPKAGHPRQLWIRGVFQARPALRNLVDVVAVHPYPCSNTDGPLSTHSGPGCPSMREAVQDVRQALVDAGAAKPLWVTEIGWATCRGVCPNLDGRVGVSEQTQARYVRDALRVLLGYRYVRRVFVYSSKPGEPYGMFRADRSARPAWREVAAAT